MWHREELILQYMSFCTSSCLGSNMRIQSAHQYSDSKMVVKNCFLFPPLTLFFLADFIPVIFEMLSWLPVH